MKTAAEYEDIDAAELMEKIKAGIAVIPKNVNHDFSPRAVGEGLKTKVNANIGTSPDHICVEEELAKLDTAVEAGADAVMDLSTGGDLKTIRDEIIRRSPVMIGTVPLYKTAASMEETGRDILEFTKDDIFSDIEDHCRAGVDFITVHCGITKKTVESFKESNRIAGIVSRGGTMMAAWISQQKAENPLYEYYDRLLEIAYEYDVTLSLGDGLRPGSVIDATDKAQIDELKVLGELARRARKKEVQVMIEGPGHVPFDQIKKNITMQKEICDNAPFYVLGPLTTDIAPGYDHITSAIGGAAAASYGADFLCYVTPAEHLRLPTVQDVFEGVIAAKIAAHSGDIAKGVKGAIELDRTMSKYRKELDWEGMFKTAIDPKKAINMRKESEDFTKDVCTMCGKFCSLSLQDKI
jgi:phosphomethylpyrimidine synthase